MPICMLSPRGVRAIFQLSFWVILKQIVEICHIFLWSFFSFGGLVCGFKYQLIPFNQFAYTMLFPCTLWTTDYVKYILLHFFSIIIIRLELWDNGVLFIQGFYDLKLMIIVEANTILHHHYSPISFIIQIKTLFHEC